MAHLSITNKKLYEGPTDDAPRWARQLAAPWYRRFLMNTVLQYVICVVSILLCQGINTWWGAILTAPGFFLLIFGLEASRKMWYRNRFVELEVKHGHAS